MLFTTLLSWAPMPGSCRVLALRFALGKVFIGITGGLKGVRIYAFDVGFEVKAIASREVP